MLRRRIFVLAFVPLAWSAARAGEGQSARPYPDGRPAARYRLAARDQGRVLRYGDGPGRCDYLGARDVWAWEHGGTYYMHYDEPRNRTWFLFTNHVGLEGFEYTDAVWVYWTRDLNRWDPEHKAVVLDGANCTWSRKCIGLPSVLKVGDRLAVLCDAPGGDSKSHMKRDVGLAWLDLPLAPPSSLGSR